MTDTIIVIVGPTAVGKTKLSVELARQINGEIISGDSMQVYCHMNIGTAKVTKAEMMGVPHHLIDIKEFDEEYSVMEFQQNVRTCIKEIQARQHTPIIVGGTGLYIKAALYDYCFHEENQSNEQDYRTYSNEELYVRLQAIDPQSAKQIHMNNRRRVIRALQIYDESGQSKSERLSTQEHKCLYDVRFIGLNLDRAQLYERINLRVDMMAQNGLLEEIQGLIAIGATAQNQSMKAIGYKEWFDYFNHQTDLETTLALIKQNSRRYAKRQYTWFLNQMDIHWLDVDLACFDNTVKAAMLFIEKGNHYRYIAFNYHFQNLDYFKHSGILKYWLAYGPGEKENPTYYDLKVGRYHHPVFIVVYFDEQQINVEALKSLYQIGFSEKVESYVKPDWQFQGKPINKLIRIKENL